jgi:hypothetical protein
VRVALLGLARKKPRKKPEIAGVFRLFFQCAFLGFLWFFRIEWLVAEHAVDNLEFL